MNQQLLHCQSFTAKVSRLAISKINNTPMHTAYDHELYAGFKLLSKSSLTRKFKISQTFDISSFYEMFCFALSLFSQIYLAKV